MTYRTVVLLITILCGAISPALACSAGKMRDERAKQVINDAFYIGLVQTADVEVIDDSLANREIKYTLEPVWPFTTLYWEPITVREIGINSCAKTPPGKGSIFEAVIFKNESGFRLGSQGEHGFTGYRWEKLRQETPNPKSQKLIDLEEQCRAQGSEIVFKHSGGTTQLLCVNDGANP